MKPGKAADSRRALGAAGERLAAAYLTRAGYRIVERNWRCAFGELDLVASLGATLVFVEVRTRRGPTFGSPEESLTPRKRARLARLADAYLATLAEAPATWRIDFVAVDLDAHGRPHLRHLPSVAGEP
jgi:putative endonuclease